MKCLSNHLEYGHEHDERREWRIDIIFGMICGLKGVGMGIFDGLLKIECKKQKRKIWSRLGFEP